MWNISVRAVNQKWPTQKYFTCQSVVFSRVANLTILHATSKCQLVTLDASTWTDVKLGFKFAARRQSSPTKKIDVHIIEKFQSVPIELSEEKVSLKVVNEMIHENADDYEQEIYVE